MNPVKRIPVALISPLREIRDDAGKVLHTLEANRKFALTLCDLLSDAGLAPFAGHAFYPEFLNDTIPEERIAGMENHLAWLSRARAAVVAPVRGVSNGMSFDIEAASAAGISIFIWRPDESASMLAGRITRAVVEEG